MSKESEESKGPKRPPPPNEVRSNKSAIIKAVTFFFARDTVLPLCGLLFVFGLFSIGSGGHLLFTGNFLRLILIQAVVIALGALGMTIILATGGIDLSVGSVVAFVTVLGATMMVKGYSTAATVTFSLLASGFIGLLNGLVIGYFRIRPFIVTLVMMGVVRMTALWLSGHQTVTPPSGSPLYDLLVNGAPPEFFGLPFGVWITVGLAVIVAVMLKLTAFGRYIAVIGSADAAQSLNTTRMPVQSMIVYALAGFFFGLAGLMELSRFTQGDPTAAIGLELDVVAAALIGGASLCGGKGSVLGSMTGALILVVLSTGSVLMDWTILTQVSIVGVVIIFVVGLDTLRKGKTDRNIPLRCVLFSMVLLRIGSIHMHWGFVTRGVIIGIVAVVAVMFDRFARTRKSLHPAHDMQSSEGRQSTTLGMPSIPLTQPSASKLPLIFVVCAIAVPVLTAIFNTNTGNGGYHDTPGGVRIYSGAVTITSDDMEPTSGDFAWRYFQWGVVDGAKLTDLRYFFRPVLGYESGNYMARLLNIGNPTPFMITFCFLVIAWLSKLFTRRKRRTAMRA